MLLWMLFAQMARGIPTDPQALQVTHARHLAMAEYQRTPPAELLTAPAVTLPHREDTLLQTAGGFYWFQFDVFAHPDHTYEAIYIPRMAMNGEVYLNDERVGYFGPLTGDYAERNWNRPLYVQLAPSLVKPGMNRVSIQIRVFPDYMAGLSTVWVGSDENLREAYLSRRGLQITSVFFSTSFIIGAGIVLLILVALRETRKWNLVLLALTCMLWGLRNLAFLATEPPVSHGHWVQISQGGLLFFASTVFLMVLNYCKVPRGRWERKAWWTYLLTFPALLLVHEEWSLRVVEVYGSVILLGYLWCVRLLWRHANLNQALDAHAFSFGLLCFCILSIHDLLLLAGYRSFDGYFLNQYMGIVMFLVLSYFMIDRYSRLLKEADQFNETLQARLARREAELAAQYHVMQQIDAEKVKLSERQRLMADMHDGIGAYLVAAIHQLRGRSTDTQATLTLLEDGLRDLQLSIDSLEPMEQDLTTLLGSFRYRITSTLKAAGIELQWQVDAQIPPLPYLDPRNCLNLLRVLQEVFANILKHAGASLITLHVSNGDRSVGVQIVDNGVGFDSNDHPAGRGLHNMQQRIALMGGKLTVTAQPGQGTRVLIELPIQLPTSTSV
ncbi:MAG TPA: ATP-binding protein [Limnobacter sp.]|uniref:sensor histidine kinase n=1 Tax=Limnobacter sp. TaxID=2003368 RepID=UPI002EDAC9EA